MRGPIRAAGGIVLRPGEPVRIALVRLRKNKEWVLPKGKLNRGETARAAAEREVIEETGHGVSVGAFAGTLAYPTGGRTKIVHFWRMEVAEGRAGPLMRDISAVDWLPLQDALERLSRDHERAFLAEIGPVMLGESAGAPDGAPAPAMTFWQRLTRWLRG